MRTQVQFIVLLFGFLLLGCSSEEDYIEPTPPQEPKTLFAQKHSSEGMILFQTHCEACHKQLNDNENALMKGIYNRAPSKDWVYKWIRNSAQLIADKDTYAVALFTKWNKIPMPPFPKLTDTEIDQILAEFN